MKNSIDTNRRISYIIVFLVIALAHTPHILFYPQELTPLWTLTAFSLLLYVAFSLNNVKEPSIETRDVEALKKAFNLAIFLQTNRDYSIWRSSELPSYNYPECMVKLYERFYVTLRNEPFLIIEEKDMVSFLSWIKQTRKVLEFKVKCTKSPTIPGLVILWEYIEKS